MNGSAPDAEGQLQGMPVVADPSWAEPAPPGAEQRDIERVILSGERIMGRIRALGEAITRAYAPEVAGNRLVLAITLRGAALFAADLARVINLPLELDFISAASYGDRAVTSGSVRFLKDLETNIEDRHVLIIEDILDSGLTLAKLVETLEVRNPASLRVCALLDKGKPFALRARPGTIGFTGFLIPDEFVVGYGLDFAQRYRNLPYVGVLRPEVYMRASDLTLRG
ncbi:MAG TPA: hypoxanthine phosphoribosyltransferase [Ktedonobacterales bacterium]